MNQQINISLTTDNSTEAMITKSNLQAIVNNFSKENLAYIAELSRSADVNTKFAKLKNNPMVKLLLR